MTDLPAILRDFLTWLFESDEWRRQARGADRGTPLTAVLR